MFITRIKRLLVGDPLANEMACHERIPKWKALAVLSSDALSSVAYATEEILIPLAAFSVAAVTWSIPIAIAITLLLVVITLSYRQTIDAYPNGGGAYTVAKENLGTIAALVAGASLLIDYTLTVSVSVAAGVENIASAFPALKSHVEALDIFLILVVMIFNLRGVKESSNLFAFPTYLFIVSFLVLIVCGIWKAMSGEVVMPVNPGAATTTAVPIFLLLRAFSSGCTALTGVEAISNGIPVFREPAQNNAKTTMLWMGIILGTLFLSITILAHVFGIIPKEGETAVSLLARAVFGQSFFYYVIQASTALILILAANTSYADFPRLSSLLARDRFLPRQLASLGDRLVFSNGIMGLSAAAIFLIILFKGDVHLLIPLYAVGVFLSFTLSQAGMVVHHLKYKEPHWMKSLCFNALGGVSTLIVLIVIGSTKFIHGAWIVVILIPILVAIFLRIRGHYETTARQLSKINLDEAGAIAKGAHHVAILPLSGIHPGVIDGFRYALSISKDVRLCYVELDPEATVRLKEQWKKVSDVPIVVLPSPYRSIMEPLIQYIDEVANSNPNSIITVVIPEFITAKWYHQFLHNQTALFLHAFLRIRRRRVITTSIRYYLED